MEQRGLPFILAACAAGLVLYLGTVAYPEFRAVALVLVVAMAVLYGVLTYLKPGNR